MASLSIRSSLQSKFAHRSVSLRSRRMVAAQGQKPSCSSESAGAFGFWHQGVTSLLNPTLGADKTTTASASPIIHGPTAAGNTSSETEI